MFFFLELVSETKSSPVPSRAVFCMHGPYLFDKVPQNNRPLFHSLSSRSPDSVRPVGN